MCKEIKKVTARLICKGAIVSMPDRNPTGHYRRHNYVVISNINQDTNTVICMGITTCRRGLWQNVIPITATNGVGGYINLNTYYTYTVSEFEDGHHHGFITDPNVMDILIKAFKLNIGMISEKKIEAVKKEISNWAVSVQNQTPLTDDVDDEDEYDEPKPVNTTQELNNSEKDSKSLYPFHMQDWSDEQLYEFEENYRNKNYDKCLAVVSIKQSSLGSKVSRVRAELSKRGLEVPPFSTKSIHMVTKSEKIEDVNESKNDGDTTETLVTKVDSTTETNEPIQDESVLYTEKPNFTSKAKRFACTFWTSDELQTFEKLYETEEGQSILKTELNLNNSGLIQRHTEVMRHIKARRLA